MSAAQARRRKQLLLKKQQQEAASASVSAGGNGNDGGDGDPVSLRLQSLLAAQPSEDDADNANYEALQLAQSLIRRYVKSGEVTQGVSLAYDVSMAFLTKKKRAVSVSSQLLGLFADVLIETGAAAEEDKKKKKKKSKQQQQQQKGSSSSVNVEEMVSKLEQLHVAYREALASQFNTEDEKDVEEVDRLHRVYLKFLNKILRWSAEHGPVLYGDLRLHALLGEQCWHLGHHAVTTSTSEPLSKDEEDESAELRADAVSHYALAEKHNAILNLLKQLPVPTRAQEKMGRHRAAERDCLFTRAILVYLSLENLQDAHTLLNLYVAELLPQHRRSDLTTLAQSYVDKKDGFAPTHVMFCNMLLQTCEKDRAGPLFQWLLRSFAADLNTLPGNKPDAKVYTTKIGRVYFGIMPPPSMLNMMENMMGMMGGGGAGMPGLPPGMANNPAMAAMMQQAAAGRM